MYLATLKSGNKKRKEKKGIQVNKWNREQISKFGWVPGRDNGLITQSFGISKEPDILTEILLP